MEVDTTMLTYTQLLNNTIKIYKTEGPKSAFNYIETHYSTVIGIEPQIYNFRYATAAAANLSERALELLEEAVLTKKYWYSVDYLSSDDDLNGIRDDERFKRCLQLCEAREIVAIESNHIQYKEIPSISHTPSEKVLIAFHGNQENYDYTWPYWSTSATDKYNKIFPQSPTIEFSHAYTWDDDLSPYEEVIDTLSKYKHQILTGFSAGAHMALETALTTPSNCKGLILVAPWIPDVDLLNNRLGILKNYKLPIYLICGTQDEDCYDCTIAFKLLLDTHSIEYSFHEINELDHDYPTNFDQYLDCGIKYIENHQLLDSRGFDKWSGTYDKSIDALSNGYPFEGYYDTLSSIQRIVNNIKVKEVLDMGIGTGLLTKKLYDQDYFITGIDFSEKMIEKAREKMPDGRFYVSDFNDGLPPDIEKNTYDAIISSYALHHLNNSDKVALIYKLFQRLAYGGVLIIGDIAFENEQQLLTSKQMAGDDWDHQEFYFTANTLLEALKAVNICATYQQISSCAGLLKIIKL